MNEVCTSYGSTPSVYLSAPVIHRIVSKSYTLKMRPLIAPALTGPDWIGIHDCCLLPRAQSRRSTSLCPCTAKTTASTNSDL